MTFSFNQFIVVRALLASGMLLYAINAILRFSEFKRKVTTPDESHVIEILFWTIGPPIWFFIEYFLIDHGFITPPNGKNKEQFLEATKNYAGTASKIWAAVLGVLTFMYSQS